MSPLYIIILAGALLACFVGLFSRKKRKAEPKTYLFFDTETTGLPKNFNAPVTDVDNWPRLVQLSWILTDNKGMQLSEGNLIVKPFGFVIPEEVAKLHGITQAHAMAEGLPVENVLSQFLKDVEKAECLVGHNVSFDLNIVGAELIRAGRTDTLHTMPSRCTMRESTDYCKLPGKVEGKFKFPKLIELHRILFCEDFENAHNAFADITATQRCFWELKKRGVM